MFEMFIGIILFFILLFSATQLREALTTMKYCWMLVILEHNCVSNCLIAYHFGGNINMKFIGVGGWGFL